MSDFGLSRLVMPVNSDSQGASDFDVFQLAICNTSEYNEDISTSANPAGNACWMAPELFNEEVSHSKETDVWACGMTLLVRFA